MLSIFSILSLSFYLLNGYLAVLYLFCLFAAPQRLSDNTADSLCNIYVLISDTRFRRIKGLARIHHHLHHPWHRTSPIFPPVELVGLESFIVYSRGRGFCCIFHHNTNVITYISSNW